MAQKYLTFVAAPENPRRLNRKTCCDDFFKNSLGVISGALDWLIKSPLLLAKRKKKKIMPVLALRNRKFVALKKQSFYT